MKKCGNCHMYKNGCDFSNSELPEDILKDYVACADCIDEKDFCKKLSAYEKTTRLGE